jgi:hypothetical protein
LNLFSDTFVKEIHFNLDADNFHLFEQVTSCVVSVAGWQGYCAEEVYNVQNQRQQLWQKEQGAEVCSGGDSGNGVGSQQRQRQGQARRQKQMQW